VTKLIKLLPATIIFCNVYQGIIIQYSSKTLYDGEAATPPYVGPYDVVFYRIKPNVYIWVIMRRCLCHWMQ